MRNRHLTLAKALVVSAALAIPGLSGAAAQAAPTTLYVNNAAGAGCSDQGGGTPAQPYCTVGAAAAVVQPGQTVLVYPGSYPEELDITRSGTAAAPVTFQSAYPAAGAQEALIGGYSFSQGIEVDGAQYVTVAGFSAMGQSEGIEVDDSQDVTVERNEVRGVGGGVGAVAGIEVANSTGTVVTTDSVDDVTGGAVGISSAPGTVLTGNTLSSGCQQGIGLSGSSPDAVIENNIVDPDGPGQDCLADLDRTGLFVASGSTSGTRVGYNLFDDTDSAYPPYNWGGTPYATPASFTAATGQGAHDLLGATDAAAAPNVPARAAVDSANATAPGELATDLDGNPRVDVRSAPNTGTGSGYYDRGAFEAPALDAYHPLAPTRVLDTRSAVGVRTTTPVAPGGAATITLGAGDQIPAGASGVVLNVTVTGGTSAGALKVTAADPQNPNGSPEPVSAITATDLSWGKGETIANLVTVPVGAAAVSFTNTSTGSVQVVADLEGYFAETAADGYTTVGPTRILDTRNATGTRGTSPLGSGAVLSLPVAGQHGVPANASAVVLNVTVTAPGSAGYVTVYPYGQKQPTVSNINFVKGQTVPNLVVVPVGSGGRIDILNHSSSAHVVADLEGYYSPQGLSTFLPWGPERILDTTAQGATRLGAYDSVTLTVDDEHGLTGFGSPTAAAVELTVLHTGAAGYLVVYPYGSAKPATSNANWTKGQSVSSLAVVPARDGRIVVTNHSAEPVDLYADLEGDYFDM